jgi:hypothetical protein
MGGIKWPMRGGGETTMLPPSVVTGRVVFQSQFESCCVAVDPTILSGSAHRGLAILTNLPVGPATVTVAGFTTDFAPTVAGILATCDTAPAQAAHPCDAMRVAAPAFESPPLAVTILSGVQTNLPEVPIAALPFVLDYSPPQDAIVTPPFNFAFTVVDAVTGIRPESVALDVSFQVPSDEPPSFRTITKRVHIDLNTCDDGSDAPCSQTGKLDLAGFKALGAAPELPEGPVEARITAENLADPPRDVDFRYSFNVLATPTETETSPPVSATPESAGGSPAAGEVSSAAAQDPTAGEPPALPASDIAQPPVATPTVTPRPGGEQ